MADEQKPKTVARAPGAGQGRAAAAAQGRQGPGRQGAGRQGPGKQGPGKQGQKPEPPRFETSASRNFMGWMRDQGASLAFTTYQAGMLFLLGMQPNGRLSVHKRTMPRCMGMLVHGNSIYISSLYQFWRFENQLRPGQQHQGHDRLYVPKVGFVTGDLDVHDIAVDAKGRVIFVNTLFGCLATVSPVHSFVPLWKPPFISKLAAEDRCHLNGLAMREGRPAFVSAVAESDVADGWREHRRGGGVIVDVAKNEVVLRGLSMPHSPRWYKGRLWLHNSGTGYFGYADLRAGKFVPVAFCPGYLRGLDFIGDYAVVGLSKPRHKERGAFGGLELQENLEKKKAAARCALFIVDLKSGDAPHWFRMEGAVQELYDVAVIPNCRRPMAIGFQSDEIRRVISMGRPGQAPMLHVLPQKQEDAKAAAAASGSPAAETPSPETPAAEAPSDEAPSEAAEAEAGDAEAGDAAP